MQTSWIEAFEGARQGELYDLYKSEWWTTGRTFEDVVSMVRHSDLSLGCCSGEGKLIGFTRVLTDYTFKALIFDVIVHRDYRGRGVGEAILDRVVKHSALERVLSFELYCPDDLVPFYSRFGFSKGTANLLFLERERHDGSMREPVFR